MNVLKLKAALAARDMREWRLALRLGLRPSTFSAYVRGSRIAPSDFEERVERELGLGRGELRDDGGPNKAA